MQETQVQSLGQKGSLEEGMATHPSILAWRIPVDKGAWPATVHRVLKSRTQLKWLGTHLHNIFEITKFRNEGLISFNSE